MEQKVKQQLGEMLFTILALQYQLEEARQQAELANKKLTELQKVDNVTQL